MRLVAKKGLVTAMAAGGVLAAAAGYAQADSGAQGTSVGSPGLLSGDLVQLPVHVPVNVCGNTVNVIGLLNPASGNACANTSSGAGAGSGATDSGGSHATGEAARSPGVGSGLAVQLPVHVPVNVSGNSVGAVSVLNPTTGNTSVNGSVPPPVTPPAPPAPVVAPPRPVSHPVRVETAHVLPAEASLAHTGTSAIGYEAAASAASLLAGVVLYRRFRPGRRG